MAAGRPPRQRQGRLLSLLLLCGPGLTAAAAAKATAKSGTKAGVTNAITRTLSGAGAAQKDDILSQVASSPLLTSLAQELHAEAAWDAHFGWAMAKWCNSARSQKASLEDALQRRVNEADIALRQLQFEEQRLTSEEKLVNMTATEQKQQLNDATTAAELATREYAAEQHDLDVALEAANHADRVAQAEDPDAAVVQPRLQRQQILLLRKRLEKARNTATIDDEAMVEKLQRLSMDQGAALLATQSRAAALRVEVAQRRRERERLTARRADLVELLEAARHGRPATEDLCAAEAQEPAEVLARVNTMNHVLATLRHKTPVRDHRADDLMASVGAMSHELQALLGQAAQHFEWHPPADTVTEAVPSTADAGSSTAGAAPSFLQTNAVAKTEKAAIAEVALSSQHVKHALADLKSLSWRFPEESAWYKAASQRLNAGMARLPADEAQQPAAAGSSGASALSDLRQFVEANTDDDASDENAEEGLAGGPADQVTTVYAALLNRVRAKETMVAGRKGSCALMSRSFSADSAALTRVQSRAEERLGVTEAVVKSYKEDGEYAVAQKAIMEEQLRQLADLEAEVDRWTPHASGLLQKHVDGLVSLAASLRSQPVVGPMVQDLSKQVAVQQDALMRRRSSLAARRRAIEAADRELMGLLDQDVQRGRRRLVQIKPELQLWTALSHSKDTIKMLDGSFQRMADTLCSKDRLKKLSAKDQELLREEAALRTAAASSADA